MKEGIKMDENAEKNDVNSTEQLKQLGNAAVRDCKFELAVLHYTHAIKRDSKNEALYTNRSLAFLKLQQYTLALEDAEEAIRLNPAWPKGYFRKGQVQFETFQFEDALDSYECALRLKPYDSNIVEAIERTKRAHHKELKNDQQIPWLGSGIGIVIGVIILIADYALTTSPTHPIAMAFITIAIAIVGYGVAKLYRYYLKLQRASLLTPLAEEENTENGEVNKTEHRSGPRYTKSQARQRFKKGKM